ncbi:MAG: polyprenol monophosphomannose synthase [Candidatus Bathyarchaeia archaeon]
MVVVETFCQQGLGNIEVQSKQHLDNIIDGVVEGNLNLASEAGLILPTYCEAKNIEEIICKIEELKLNLSILVVDDSSPDGTANIVRRLQKKYKNIILLSRPKKMGLGTAIVDGFKLFLSLKKPPKFILTMDADHSHNPKEILRLLASAKNGGYDLCVGSRYCHGGVVKNWSPIRRFISKTANLIAKLVVGAGISDYTSGMRCYSIKLVRSILHELHSQTYEIQIETVRLANLKNLKIGEIPITFTNRKKGKSKLTLNEVKRFLFYVVKAICQKIRLCLFNFWNMSYY